MRRLRPLSHKQLNGLGRSNVISEVGACAPAAPAQHPRDRGPQCRRSFPASQGHEPRQQAVTVHAHAFPRATRIGHANGPPTRYEDPALACLLRREEQPSRQRPLWCGFATSTLRSCCTPRCSRNPDECRGSAPTPPAERRQTACSFTVPCPALVLHSPESIRGDGGSPDPIRHLHRVNPDRVRIGNAGWVPGRPENRRRRPDRDSSVSSIARLPSSSTGSPQALSSSSKAGPPARLRIVWPS